MINGMSGRYVVRTWTSTYVLDLDAMTSTRFPGLGAFGDPLFRVDELRNDEHAVPLIALRQLTLGESMILLLDVRGDGVPTLRRTTPVISCSPLREESCQL